jgi:hypothetical protein
MNEYARYKKNTAISLWRQLRKYLLPVYANHFNVDPISQTKDIHNLGSSEHVVPSVVNNPGRS